MIVIRMAITPSLNASSRPLLNLADPCFRMALESTLCVTASVFCVTGSDCRLPTVDCRLSTVDCRPSTSVHLQIPFDFPRRDVLDVVQPLFALGRDEVLEQMIAQQIPHER